MHPERNADVVLFLDTFAEARRDDLGTLDISVRAAAALAALYLREKDRVGVVSFGGVLNWLTVTSGTTQLYRIVDSLLDAEIVLSYAWKDLDVIPPRTLPPRALVIALSPLLDERAVGALLDLRARGFDLAVVELSPFPFVPEGETETKQLAYRLWRLRREALRSKYAALGVPIVEWHEGVPMEAVVEEVRAFRRHARVVRASDRSRRAPCGRRARGVSCGAGHRAAPARARARRAALVLLAFGLLVGWPGRSAAVWPRSAGSTPCSSPRRGRRSPAHARLRGRDPVRRGGRASGRSNAGCRRGAKRRLSS